MPLQANVARTLLTLRIVFGAMIAGVVIFGALVVLVLRPEPSPGNANLLLASLAFLGLTLIVAWVVVSRVLRRGLRNKVAEAAHEETAAVTQRGFFSVSLVGAALGEAFCFLALVVHLLTAAPMALFAAAAGLLTLLAQIPTADRFHRFAEEVMGHRPS